MNKEELRKEATFTIEWECTPIIDRPLFVHAYITGALPREKCIAKLKKEYASLKGLRKYELNVAKLEIEKIEKENVELKEQFTQAKDILRRLMASQPTPSSMYEEADLVVWREVNKEAEQFLKE